MRKKSVLNLALALMLGFAIWTSYRHVTVTDPNSLDLRNGDIIFQTKFSVESPAIRAATGSPYTHVGIVYIKDERYYVIDAGYWGVRMNRFDTWVSSGLGNKFLVKRRFYVSDLQQQLLMETALHWVGRPFDYALNLSTNDAFYGSEFVYKLYLEASMPFGKPQKIADLDTDDYMVDFLIRNFWRDLPYCKDASITYDDCKAKLLEQVIITPESLASDEKMVQIYSNF